VAAVVEVAHLVHPTVEQAVVPVVKLQQLVEQLGLLLLVGVVKDLEVATLVPII
jgi:hypothetical protein